MKLNLNKQKGFSLLELLLVVAVGSILILAGLAIYRNVTQQTQVNEASRLLNVMKQEAQKLYQGEGGYGGADATNFNDVMISAGAIPSAYVTGAATINSPFDTDITIISDTPNTTFTITFASVPQEACINMGRLYTANDPDFAQVLINTTALTAPTIAAVTAACAGGQTMAWTFN